MFSCNSDMIESVDTLYFPDHAEALRHVVKEHGKLVEEFISPPIDFVNGDIDGWRYRMIERFQSGKVLYRWQTSEI